MESKKICGKYLDFMRPRSLSMFQPDTRSSEHKAVKNPVLDNEHDIKDLSNCYYSSWTIEDSTKLFDIVQKQLPKGDKKQSNTRLLAIDWKEIEVGSHSPEECQAHFTEVYKEVRHHRTLAEVIVDMYDNLNKLNLKRPLTAFLLYSTKERAKIREENPDMNFKDLSIEVSKRYKNLSEKQKKKYYRVAGELREDYMQKKNDFLKIHPKQTSRLTGKFTVTHFFYKQNLHLGNFVKCSEIYKNLPNEEKLDWIQKAITESALQNPPIRPVLTRLEENLYKGIIKKPPSAYNIFLKDVMPKIPGEGHQRIKKVSQMWKELDSNRKCVYENRAAKERVKYVEESSILINKLKENNESSILSDSGESSKKKNTSKNISEKKTKNNAHLTKNTVAHFKESSVSLDDIKDEDENDIIGMDIVMTEIPIQNISVSSTEKKKARKKGKRIRDEHRIGDILEIPSKKKQKSTSGVKILHEEPKQRIEKPVKPPKSFYDYYVEFEYKGKSKHAEKSYRKLTKSERQTYKARYRLAQQQYLKKLESYLPSLSKEEVANFYKSPENRENVYDSDTDSDTEPNESDSD